MKTFRIRLLPAGHGDCILVEYGDPLHRILIDGGTGGTAERLASALDALPAAERELELVVVTHIDADHIDGMVKMAQAAFPLAFQEFWFNGYRHLPGLEPMGAPAGEILSTWLDSYHRPRWNKSFHGEAVAIPDAGALVEKPLQGGMKLTLLSPTLESLRQLKPKWAAECAKAGLVPGEPVAEVPPPPPGLEPMGLPNVEALAAATFEEDDSVSNGSSIAFLAEFDNRAVLFGGDAHPGTLEASLKRLPGGPAKLAALKVPHHGSKHNLSDGLLSAIDTRRFLLSTNGAYFKHPDREAIARILVRRTPECELHFNARSAFTEVWGSGSLQEDWGYRAFLPDPGESGAVVDV